MSGETPTHGHLVSSFFGDLDGNLVRVDGQDPGWSRQNRCSILASPLSAGFPTGATRGTDPVRRTPLPHQLLVPRRCLGTGRPGRAGRRAGADRAGRHGPQRPVRRGPFRQRGRGGRAPPGRRSRDRAARPGRRRPGRDRRPAAPTAPPPPRRGPAGRRSRPDPAARRDRGPARPPRPTRARLPGHREPVKEDLRGIGERVRGPHLVLLARSQVGWRSLCRLVSRANMAGTKGVPRFSQALLAEHTEGLVALSGCRDGELARRLRTGDRPGRAPSPSATRRCSGAATGRPRAASSSSSRTTSCPTTTGSSPRRRRWPRRPGCRSSSPTTSTTPDPRTASWPTS